MNYDVVIIGGGPAGLSAALALGRARRRVLLCDAGSRRNAAAVELHNFVTRDGIAPAEFRRLAREQLRAYESVHVQDTAVEELTGERGAFHLRLPATTVLAKRVLITTGMIDTRLPIPGFEQHWGHGVVQCPYCHGWEARDRPWGFLMTPLNAAHAIPFALQLRCWTNEVTVFTNGSTEIHADSLAPLRSAGLRVETTPIKQLNEGPTLHHVELADGTRVPCELLLAHPPQRQTALVTALRLDLDELGYVKTDPMRKETSRPGIYAAGDLTTPMQGAIFAAAAGTQAAAMLNLDVAMEQAQG